MTNLNVQKIYFLISIADSQQILSPNINRTNNGIHGKLTFLDNSKFENCAGTSIYQKFAVAVLFFHKKSELGRNDHVGQLLPV